MNQAYDATIEDYVSRVIGQPPANFKSVVAFAQLIGKWASRNKLYRPEWIVEALIVAALAFFETEAKPTGGNRVAFVQRVKQVLKWCEGPWRDPTTIEQMENKRVEIARQIALRLYNHEGFVLMLFNMEAVGPEYGISHVSNVQREHAIQFIEDYVKVLKGVPLDAKVIVGVPGRRPDDNDIN
jgi:hypothetical protein